MWEHEAMPQIGLRELSHHTARIVDRVRHGETIEITDHGMPIFRMVPIKPTGSLLDRLVQQGRVAPPTASEEPSGLLTDRAASRDTSMRSGRVSYRPRRLR
jgi:prevent-host-death family protein